MIMWMSEEFRRRFSVDQSCVAAQKNAALSHDNLFHSLLGLLDINTRERNASLDIFAACRPDQRVAKQ